MGGMGSRYSEAYAAVRSFVDDASVGLNVRWPFRRTDEVCMFCSDCLMPACMVVSDLADVLSGNPVPLITDSRLPGWVDDGTLAIVVSYEGDRSLVELLESRGSATVLVTSKENGGGSDVVIPEGVNPSAFVLGVVCSIMSSTGVFDPASALVAALESIRSDEERIVVEAESLAGSIRGRLVSVYSPSDIRACSYAWVDLIRRSYGQAAFRGELPEFDHNELVGWSDPNEHAPELRMIVFRGEPDETLPSMIMGFMQEVLEENGRSVKTVYLGSGSSIERNVRGMIMAVATAIFSEAE